MRCPALPAWPSFSVLALGLCRLRPGAAAAPQQKPLDARLADARGRGATLAGKQQTLLGRLRQLQVARENAARRARAVPTRPGAGRPEVGRGRRARRRHRSRAARGEAGDPRAPRAHLQAAADRVRPRCSSRWIRRGRSIAPRASSSVVAPARPRPPRAVPAAAPGAARPKPTGCSASARRSRRCAAALQQEEAALGAKRAPRRAALLRQIRGRREVNAQLVDELTAARDRLDRSVTTLGPRGYGRPATRASRARRTGPRAPAACSTGPWPGRLRPGSGVRRRAGSEPRSPATASRSARPWGAACVRCRRPGGVCRCLHRLRTGRHRRPRGQGLHASTAIWRRSTSQR